MTFRSHTFFSALAVIAAAAVANAAVVSGSVRIVDSKSEAVQKRRDYSGVVVWLERTDGSPVAATPRTYVMEQRRKTFLPHVLAITAGSTVDFPNFDPIFHNAFSNFAGQPFDVGLYAPGTSQKVRFRRDGIVRVFCNIHPTMSAVIAVLHTPYFEVTPLSGSFTLPDVAPGRYRLRVFHERATEASLTAAGRAIDVGENPISLSAISVSEAGYVVLPHKNKHGRDYPPLVEDTPVYSGKRP